MTIDATFWVAYRFLIFIGALIYFKIPGKVITVLNESILAIKIKLIVLRSLRKNQKIY